jgi:hypothetical protein
VIGFIVEGPTDKAAVKALCERLGIRSTVRIMEGNKPRKAEGLIEQDLLKIGVDRIIILKDTRSSQTLLGEMSRLVRRISDLIRTDLIIIRQALEAWFLSDPTTVERVLGHRSEVRNPEECEDPAKELDRVARRCGKRYIKSARLVRRIVERMNLNRARRRCSSLDLFINIVTAGEA